MEKKLNIVDEMAISQLASGTIPEGSRSISDWVRTVRLYLRMTQSQLAKRAGIPQSHVAAIEGGRLDPRLSTLKKVFEALSCQMSLEPRPKKALRDILRDQARARAAERVKKITSTIEGEAPEPELFNQLVEKEIDEILNRREKLWE